jgi:hypothetical protein
MNAELMATYPTRNSATVTGYIGPRSRSDNAQNAGNTTIKNRGSDSSGLDARGYDRKTRIVAPA